ncbi:dCMP deaminase [Paenibacillus sp. UNC496MF]|uniref:deoxycytidylate deaminase n=1 Tax=Paenibacillus sp. UNC496MF TaxID=1502753 RepID=UPI0008E40C60|nr:cytidine/deoxycytidylate deaminase family protein [Paenibacillus sp. UNC496MF]SFJ65178.1 dCMP deaminase [Paenibacillus sp. UNC496MF]
MRKDWDSYWIDIAKKVADRGTCNRLQVGCIIVKNNRLIAAGYNGSIHGHDHCDDVGHLLNDEGRCIRTLHAEENAILHTNRRDLIGATAYVTHEPCENCTKRLNQAGVKRVVFLNAYPNKWNKHFKVGMEWVHYYGADRSVSSSDGREHS